MLEVFLLDTRYYSSSCCDPHFLFLFSVEQIFGLAILILYVPCIQYAAVLVLLQRLFLGNSTVIWEANL